MKRTEERRELRAASAEEAQKKLTALQEELMKLQFKHASGQLPKSGQLRLVRRSIARTETILRELTRAKA